MPGVVGEGAGGQRAGQRELDEDGQAALLVHGQRVDALGLARLAEHDPGLGHTAGVDERPAGLLEVRGQEVRDGPGQAAGDRLVAVLGGAGLGPGQAGQRGHRVHDSQGVFGVLGVVQQHPAGEPERAPADERDRLRDGVQLEPQKAEREILGAGQRLGGEPDDRPVAQRRVAVAAGLDRVGGLGRGLAGRGEAAGAEEVVDARGHASSSSSSAARPAWISAAMRMPSE